MRRAEQWFEDVYPGDMEVFAHYRGLTRRELAMIASSVMDVALATVIRKRLRDIPNECEQFLGLNGDGRAPAATFGARIQLALLLGIITNTDASILRSMKSIRNVFAHRVSVDFTSPELIPLVKSLHDKLRGMTRRLTEQGFVKSDLQEFDLLRSDYDTE